jgi:hypothetical protein
MRMTDEPEDTHSPSSFARLYAMVRKLIMALGILLIVWAMVMHLRTNLNNPAPSPVIEKPVAEIPAEKTPDELSELRERVTLLEAQVKTLQDRPAPEAKTEVAPAADNAQVTHMQDQIAKQEQTLQAMSAAQSHSNRQLAALTSFGVMKDAIARGEAYAAPFDQLSGLLQDSPTALERLAQLKPYAQTGIPTLAALQNQFNLTLPKALSTTQPDGTLARNMQSLIRIRKVGETQTGSGDEAVLARAEAKIGHGDVTAALAEIKSLSPAAAPIFAAWAHNAQAYLDTGAALEALQPAIVKDEPAQTPAASPATPSE